jgi:hypothetical protein
MHASLSFGVAESISFRVRLHDRVDGWTLGATYMHARARPYVCMCIYTHTYTNKEQKQHNKLNSIIACLCVYHGSKC